MSTPVSQRWFRIAVLGLLLLVVLQSAAVACPTCKDAVAGDQNDNVKEGYFWSIIFMMSMPFVIFAALAGYFYLMIRRARKHPPLGSAAKPDTGLVASEAATFVDGVVGEEPVEV